MEPARANTAPALGFYAPKGLKKAEKSPGSAILIAKETETAGRLGCPPAKTGKDAAPKNGDLKKGETP